MPETIVQGKIEDCALGFASDFTIDRYDDFKQELIQRGKLSARTETNIRPDRDLDEKLWLGEVFQALNVARLANFSIPKRIYLNLSDKLLDFSHQLTMYLVMKILTYHSEISYFMMLSKDI